MRYPPGTQVWVRCDDGVWWPAKVTEMDAEMRAFLSVDEDCCAEFYHSPGELYPLVSTDDSRVRAFHVQPQARTVAETEWFTNEKVRAAVSKALIDEQCVNVVSDAAPAHSPPVLPTSSSPTETTTMQAKTIPYSAAELRNIQALLDAVGPKTSSQLRQQLRRARVSVAPRDVQRQETRERQTRKRQRAAVAIATIAPAAPSPTVSKAVRQWREETVSPPVAAAAAAAASTASPPLPVTPPLSTSPATTESSDWDASSSCSSEATTAEDESADGNALPFVPAARHRVLEVLRHEVFDNPAAFVLSPVYDFVEVLGAVVVDNASLVTTLPLPQALHETPATGFSPHRRVLLVPLTEDYAHTTGWMVPTELDGVSLSMSLFVNNVPVPLPANWQLSPAKEASAVKTAISVDITDFVLHSPRDLFTLQVVFSGDVAELEMWRGIIACVFVEEIGLARLGERIVGTYRKPRTMPGRGSSSHARSDRSLVNITEASVKIQCPITTLTMEIPVRSVLCEHLQCMELAAVLIQCVRQNVWNCPLCNAAMKPEDICVNYRLKDWIASHPQQLSRVEYAVETEPGSPLKVVYREVKERDDTAVEVVDDDDEE